jgi:hypothetical protein
MGSSAVRNVVLVHGARGLTTVMPSCYSVPHSKWY